MNFIKQLLNKLELPFIYKNLNMLLKDMFWTMWKFEKTIFFSVFPHISYFFSLFA